MREQSMPGGRTSRAVLIGGVVHKPASASTPAVHALLRHLEAAGFDGAPRVLGFDDEGRQMLSYLPGEMLGDQDPWPAWALTDSMLVQVGRWLRRVHDLSADFTPPPGAQWFVDSPMQPGWIYGHQDASPYNAVVDGDRLVGFFDWDIAGPSSPEIDIAFSALLWVPLAVEPGELTDDAERSRRLRVLLDAYGYEADRQVFGMAVADRARRQAAVIRHLAEAGDAAATALLPIADTLENSASYVETLPAEFWTA
jgi:Ser/Thr protein kinase RdoA (MazF antagonist)